VLTLPQAEKKAAAKARELAERSKKETDDAADVSAGAYGVLPLIGSKDYKATGTPRTELADVASYEDK
jgi:aspartyl-tRNA synthetase